MQMERRERRTDQTRAGAGEDRDRDVPGEHDSCARISLTMTIASEMEVPWRSTVLRSEAAELRTRQGWEENVSRG